MSRILTESAAIFVALTDALEPFRSVPGDRVLAVTAHFIGTLAAAVKAANNPQLDPLTINEIIIRNLDRGERVGAALLELVGEVERELADAPP